MAECPRAFEPWPDGPSSPKLVAPAIRPNRGATPRAVGAVRGAPEVGVLVALSGVLNLRVLGRNGWANTYCAAAAGR